jgi:hypothetical protein
MDSRQKVWWEQASSDIHLFEKLLLLGVAQCHLLHYLQMATEKLSKAYFWRSGKVPPKTHTGFVRFLKALLNRRPSELERIAKSLGFGRSQDLEKWVAAIQPLAYALQNVAPAEAINGPNAEYPWPHETPAQAPVNYEFELWHKLQNTGQGRRLLQFVRKAIGQFPVYG